MARRAERPRRPCTARPRTARRCCPATRSYVRQDQRRSPAEGQRAGQRHGTAAPWRVGHSSGGSRPSALSGSPASTSWSHGRSNRRRLPSSLRSFAASSTPTAPRCSNPEKGSYVGLGSISTEVATGRATVAGNVRGQLADLQRPPGWGVRAERTGARTGPRSGTSDEASYDLRITGEWVATFASGRLQPPRARRRSCDPVDDVYGRAGSTTLTRRSGWSIGRTKALELTYNLSEPRNHSYIANGIIVRNCSEYMHPRRQTACNLRLRQSVEVPRPPSTILMWIPSGTRWRSSSPPRRSSSGGRLPDGADRRDQP